MEYLLLVISAILVNNFVLSRFLGICPFLGVSKKIHTALGMSGAVIFVMTIASAVTWALQKYLLEPRGLDKFLQTLTFILVIASLVQLIDIVMKRFAPPLHAALGIFLPLITTNCAVLAIATEAAKPGFFKMNIAITNASGGLSLGVALVYTLGVSVGFGFALITFAALRERLDLAPVSRLMKGSPIAFITAGMLSLAYVGMSGWFGL